MRRDESIDAFLFLITWGKGMVASWSFSLLSIEVVKGARFDDVSGGFRYWSVWEDFLYYTLSVTVLRLWSMNPVIPNFTAATGALSILCST
jgi:hypothetical protein